MANKEFKCCRCGEINTSDYGNFFCDECFDIEVEKMKVYFLEILAEERGPYLADSPWIANDE